MKYDIEVTSRFKKEYKKAQKQGLDVNLLKKSSSCLQTDKSFPTKTGIII